MRGYFGLGQLSSEEKSDILDQHKSVYNGYQTMQPQVSNTQPLTVYDFAGDKEGLVVNNKGEVKKYSNMGINEQVSKKSMCECGGEMYEGECMECGYNEGEMEESDSDWDATLMDGLEEETGKLSDIYNVEDLNSDAGFDYIEGGSNDVDTFEGMHKNLYKEGMAYVIGSDGEPRSMKPSGKFSAFSPEDFEDDEEDMVDYENDDNEDDGFIDDQLDEQGGYRKVTDDPIEPSYDFKNKGPEQFGDDTYSIKANDMDLDDEEEWGAFDFTSGGPDDVYPVNEYETMESAFADEIDEVDVSGSQGVYGDMDPAYDFDSDGPGKGGPYQEFSYESEVDEQFLPAHAWKKMARQQAAKDKGEDFDPDEFDPSDYENLDAMSPWEDIKNNFGDSDWSEVDEDLQESFITQKNKIMEMFNRFNKYN